VELLSRPLPGDFTALYRLRVAKSGGLRLAIATAEDAGRLTISEPFGSAVSLTAWAFGQPTVHFDMKEGCRRDIEDLEEVLGVATLPVNTAVRLLGGRLPATEAESVTLATDENLTVNGAGWSAVVRLATDPWRVVEVREVDPASGDGWRIELSDHTSSVPGLVLLEHPDGRWAELDLARLEWPQQASLPDLPDFPSCGGARH
jgi:hypothetical protein